MRKERSRAELARIFWQTDAPSKLASYCSVVRVAEIPPMPPISAKPVEPSDAVVPYEQIEFYLNGQHFGDECHFAVMSGNIVVAGPYPLAQRSNLPNLRPKDSDRVDAATTSAAAAASA